MCKRYNRGRSNRGDSDLDRRLRDGFALTQACEDETITPDQHLGRGSPDSEMDDSSDTMPLVEDER